MAHLEDMLGLDIDELMTFLFTDNVVSVFISKLKDICPVHLMQFWDIFIVQGEQAIIQLIMKSFELYQHEMLQMEEDEILDFVKKGLMYVKAFR